MLYSEHTSICGKVLERELCIWLPCLVLEELGIRRFEILNIWQQDYEQF